jgi:hypothetical protein
MPVYKRRPPKVTVIRYSCVTGKAVWLYQGQSNDGLRKMYWKAQRKEQTRARWFMRRVESRKRIIQHLLDECMAALPILGELTKEQRDAVRRLKAIINEKQERYSAFYYHIQSVRRRRKRDSDIRKKMREREA